MLIAKSPAKVSVKRKTDGGTENVCCENHKRKADSGGKAL